MGRIVLASSNRGKLAEFGELFADSGFEVITQGSLGVEDAEETGLTFVENALLKARNAARATGLPALADDSGLCVDYLHNAPGLYSARYSGGHGDDAANNLKLLRELDGVPTEQRGAFFICVLALLQHADDPAPLIAEARWHGRILDAPRGTNGFGYNPLFLPDGQTASVAELDTATKNRLSHRGQALAKLHARLIELHASA
ncbi:RdgB/HAM1 family non-canonical purine NTP pyrophosphatase [Rhodanobacter sp. MP1X3]|jgi:XTP/dITP diphosphohydrolase|uniref:RdgB/HAM1 family non-canonical purine NTP pyrophosphatase n=1 Tax=Rhodanobacter sp. MP1X3 TaxID=2723086 RepID=UPI00161B7AFF|nr:RdgB/HAM1 family non-canonical purine NTP pyrophosphatase [Rhodanobacter sp. MP1X3]MBB6241295.1 XTP/dITP diphosphohydrolase [Rhodanobacter sp. MP1X3]